MYEILFDNSFRFERKSDFGNFMLEISSHMLNDQEIQTVHKNSL